ncbi:hypothetical protein Poly24_15080 [Rosistilla carotiformis]|uniref:Uncharacterized protein n=1 Tax=Rosistilla carotiformis TaxID=2528017 RepID=A0A518JQI8_9BACT|nr:hypothetical protein Poly24_15080 [Rosistilla carotiformis]
MVFARRRSGSHGTYQSYPPDLLVFGEIVAESKATKAMRPAHHGPMCNDMRISTKQIGSQIN